MEISNEIKAKVFAQYLGHIIEDKTKVRQRNILDGEFIYLIQTGNLNHKLVLKPISSITDEECKSIHDLMAWVCYQFYNVKQIIESMATNKLGFPYEIYQFLQSRGYDLPQYLLGGKTLHEAGLAIYE